MKTLIKIVTVAVVTVFTLTSCSNEQSLQEYYVANQENNDFILVDVPTSIITSNKDMLTEEQQRVFKTVRKVNIMAYPLKKGNEASMEIEKAKVVSILETDDYEQLMKVNSDQGMMRLYFKGEEDAIDEVIMMAGGDDKGFVIARLLGDDMNVGDMMKMVQSLEKGDIDLSQFGDVMDVFGSSVRDSININVQTN